MKPEKNLYEQIYDFENLYFAFLKAAEEKWDYEEVLQFAANLEENLIDIQNHLIYQTYKVGAYREKYVYEPKKRLILILPFRDRVVQWAIYRIINPIVTKGYIKDSYACIEGRGIHAAVKRIQYWQRLVENKPEEYFALHMDVEKFFFRIPHSVIMSVYSDTFGDERLIWLLSVIICDPNTPFGFPLGKIDVGRCPRIFFIGQPVGSLISQLTANLVMNRVDQFAKRKLNVHFWLRYMDDMLAIGPSKKELREIEGQVKKFLKENIGLTLNDRTSIQPVTLGIDFCGYKVWPTHIKLRKGTALRMKRRLKDVQQKYAEGTVDLDYAIRVVASYLGLLDHCDSYNLRCAIFGDRDRDIPGWFSLKRNAPEEAVAE